MMQVAKLEPWLLLLDIETVFSLFRSFSSICCLCDCLINILAYRSSASEPPPSWSIYIYCSILMPSLERKLTPNWIKCTLKIEGLTNQCIRPRFVRVTFWFIPKNRREKDPSQKFAQCKLTIFSRTSGVSIKHWIRLVWVRFVTKFPKWSKFQRLTSSSNLRSESVMQNTAVRLSYLLRSVRLKCYRISSVTNERSNRNGCTVASSGSTPCIYSFHNACSVDTNDMT